MGITATYYQVLSAAYVDCDLIGHDATLIGDARNAA